MREEWLGDSYDIVKRFVLDIVRANGCTVSVEPMFTVEWSQGGSDAYQALIGHTAGDPKAESRSALFIDPDTGIGARVTQRHVTLNAVAARASEHAIVIVFDQAFSRSLDARAEIQRKLAELENHGAYGFYYDSHARCLFCSRDKSLLEAIARALHAHGLPLKRVVWRLHG